MGVPAGLVKELREKTGIGIMECKAALEEAQGDMEKAIIILKERGLSVAAKKAGRETTEGLIGAYVHVGGKIGVLVEVNCESDFVARNEEFQQLVKDLAMQIAAADPKFVRKEDVPEEIIQREREQYRQEALRSGTPEKMMENVIQGKLAKFFSENCLYEQPFIRDPETTIGQVIVSKIAKIGENIRVRRFVRYKIGEP